MTEIALRIEALSKRYQIEPTAERHDTLRDELAARLAWLISWRRAEKGQGPSVAQADRAPARGDIWALRDVSFDVRRGEVLGVIGRNGAGKSTLLRVLSRITRPTTGRAEIHGRVGALLEVGTGFHPELTGRENVFLNGAILGMSHRELRRKFDEIVAFAEVQDFIETPVKRYSTGMYVRLAFAVAAHLEPEILMVDEVLAVGDAAFQKKCLGKMGDVARAGQTVLVVSHSMAMVLGLCTRAVVLDHGRLVFDGPPAEAAKRYQALNAGTLTRAPSNGRIRGSQSGFEIAQVTLVSEPGVAASEFRTGQPLGVRVLVRTPGNGEKFSMGAALFSQEGTYCYGINTFLDGFELVADQPTVSVALWYSELNLMDGLYSLTISVADESATVEHDRLDKACVFSVTSRLHDHGLVHLPHRWMREPGTESL